MSKSLWYAEGLRWVGTIFTDAAEHLEQLATEAAQLDPRALREADEYMNEVRSRVHTHF